MAATVVVLLVASQAATQWKQDRAQVPDEPWRKSTGRFGAMLFFVDDLGKFKAEWRKPEAPQLRSLEKTKRGRNLGVVVVFSGCSAHSGSCSVRVDYQVLRPDGTDYASQANLPAWSDRAAPAEGVLVLSESLLGIGIEPSDPLGHYEVLARVRDLNGAVQVDLRRSFAVEQ